MKMNPEVKKKWVAKLTSGEYSQTSGYLSQGGSFCCLGVLCELAVEEGVIEPPTQRESTPGSLMVVGVYDDEKGELPESVARWAGLIYTTEDGQDYPVPDPYVSNDESLASLNDNGATFDQIATIIQEEL